LTRLHTHWIESDTYDRVTLRRLREASPSLQTLESSGGKLLPHFDGFVLDLFALLFKLNVVFHPDSEVTPSASLYRLLLEQLQKHPALEVIRRQTVLDECRAGLATLLLGDRLLTLIKSERIVTRAEMLDYWNLEQQQSELGEQEEQAETALEIRQQTSAATLRQLDELAQKLQRDASQTRRRLRQKANQVHRAGTENVERNHARIDGETQRTLADLDEAAESSEAWSTQVGGSGRLSAGQQIELGKKLADNAKLKKLATMVGRMKQQALALRRTVFERADAETYEITLGADLSRILPQELLSLHHPVLRHDFLRRLVEGQLAQYALRARDERGKGPMVVCIDGSSSMAGEKEIWAKAVSLTLLDIAQRQRRPFRSICFAAADTPLQVIDLNRRQAYLADLGSVLELAEYFPGGGTDFQKPLDAAVECLRKSTLQRGDIVFITDGECHVDPTWLHGFQEAKRHLGFAVFSVLIDIGPSSGSSLRQLSDRITTVSQLTSDAGKDVFVAV